MPEMQRSLTVLNEENICCSVCGETDEVKDGIVDFVSGCVTSKLDDINYDEYRIDDSYSNLLLHNVAGQVLGTAGRLEYADSGRDVCQIGTGLGHPPSRENRYHPPQVQGSSGEFRSGTPFQSLLNIGTIMGCMQP